MVCYHCASIHPELTEVLPEFADGFAAQYYVGHGAAFGDQVKGFTVDGSASFDKLPSLGEAHDRRYYAVTVRSVRALPTCHGLTELRRWRGAGAQRAPHHRLPRLGHRPPRSIVALGAGCVVAIVRGWDARRARR